jgi:hypothetical protein
VFPLHTLDIVNQEIPNAWYLPDNQTIRLTRSEGAPGFVSHQSMHMLDMNERRLFSSLQPKSVSNRLALRATEMVRDHLNGYIEQKVSDRLSKLPPAVARVLLRGGPQSWLDVHAALIDALGSSYAPEDVGLAIKVATGGFGYDASVIRRELSEDLDLGEAVIDLFGMLPGPGVPVSMFDKTPEQRQRYYESYDVERLRRALRGYTFAPHEVYARLMDQVLREEALRWGRPIRRKERVRADDFPLTLLPEIEEQAWAVQRELGWHGRSGRRRIV